MWLKKLIKLQGRESIFVLHKAINIPLSKVRKHAPSKVENDTFRWISGMSLTCNCYTLVPSVGQCAFSLAATSVSPQSKGADKFCLHQCRCGFLAHEYLWSLRPGQDSSTPWVQSLSLESELQNTKQDNQIPQSKDFPGIIRSTEQRATLLQTGAFQKIIFNCFVFQLDPL